jgi:hypothetical protein
MINTLRPSRPPLFLFLCLAVVIASIIAVALPQVQIPSYTDHAVDRHFTVISAATSCFSGNGTIDQRVMYNKTTNRHAWMCMLDGGMYIWILDKEEQTVTMFKNKAKTFKEAIDYLIRVGYKL